MLKRIAIKWGLLLAGSTLAALQLGQCISDLVEDYLVLSIVD